LYHGFLTAVDHYRASKRNLRTGKMAEFAHHADPAPMPFSARGGLLNRLRHLAHDAVHWRARMRQRYELVELPPHLLFDIGLTRADVEAEARKRPWEGPSLADRTRFQNEH
jgi:uncharacterized protein YjiS (DUF1127 family)